MAKLALHRCAASQLGGLMAIAALPDEVLLLCFRLHVWCNSDTPQRLLRVCRRRHAIVTGTSSLWGDILDATLFFVQNNSRGKQDPLSIPLLAAAKTTVAFRRSNLYGDQCLLSPTTRSDARKYLSFKK